MSEAGVTTKKVSKSGGCASPGIGILKSWQGIVEIVLRVIVIVSACMHGAASAWSGKIV